MSLSHAYGIAPPDAVGERLLHRALDIGYDFLDTAALYGIGHNETLIGRALKSRRDEGEPTQNGEQAHEGSLCRRYGLAVRRASYGAAGGS